MASFNRCPIDVAQPPPRLTIQSDGARMSGAYGNTGKAAISGLVQRGFRVTSFA
jgi:hypothetical protein